MIRTVKVILTRLAPQAALRGTVTFFTVRPRCLEYRAAEATIDVDGIEVIHMAIGFTDESALQSLSTWMMEALHAKIVSLGEPTTDFHLP
jgi:hypothetical protein